MEASRDTIFRTRPVSVIRKGDWKLLQFHEEWILDGGFESIETNKLCKTEIEKRNELLDELLTWQNKTSASLPANENPDFIKH